MKRYNKRNFTLVELMFVVAILVILIGISWVAGTKVLRKQAKSKTKAEITMLVSAVKQYKDRFGALPVTSTSKQEIDFGQYLSKVPPNSGWTDANGDPGLRPMFIDFNKHNINVSNPDFAGANAGTTEVRDPYEQPYMYKAESDGTFKIWSTGLDGSDNDGSGDDVSSDNLQN